MLYVVILALIPLGVLLCARIVYPNDISLGEFAIGAIVSVLLGFGLHSVGKYSQMSDTELWNGSITGTTVSMDHYAHSYQYDCHTVKVGSTKVQSCKTGYHYGINMSWDAQSNIGAFNIATKDCHSTIEAVCHGWYPDPDRWTSIKVGDPVSNQHSYLNYVKASDYGLFNHKDTSDGVQTSTLEYPITIRDYYHVDRVLTDGITLPGGAEVWNSDLEHILSTIGPNKQANMILVLTKAGNPTYADMLIDKWQGANKNDILIIAGFPSGTTSGGPTWIKVFSWAKQDIMNITMRDDLLDHPEWWASPDLLFPNIQSVVMQEYVRRPMQEFDYLKDEIEPSTGMMILLGLVGLLAGLGLAVLFRHVDMFGLRTGTRLR